MTNDNEYRFTAPVGSWVRRKDTRSGKSPILAYVMDRCVLVIWSDGTHTTLPAEATFPRLNWEIWEDVE